MLNRKFKQYVIIFSFLATLFLMILPIGTKAENDLVYVVPVKATVEKGLSAFLDRAVTTATKENAKAIIFELNTPGGVVDAADEIADLLTNASIPTIAFVNKRALSAGAYIALNTDEIYMVPGSTMGAAAVIDVEGNAADQKAQSYWLSAMKGAAEQNNRDPVYALAMADPDVDLPDYGAPKGKLLTLTSDQALEAGYSEGSVTSIEEVLTKIGYPNAEIRNIDESFAEKLARFITHPLIVPILLTIGSLGLVLELYSPGFGVPGFMGISALLLFFYGHLVAGLAGYESIILLMLGIGLIILEIFIVGGIAGAIGLAAVVGSLFLAAENVVYMGVSLLIAIGISILVSILMIKVFGKKMKLFNNIILTDSTSTEKGYVSNQNRLELIGLEGRTITDLRPSGTVLVGEERMDVVSEGSFIGKNENVKIIKVEGARIVVRETVSLEKRD